MFKLDDSVAWLAFSVVVGSVVGSGASGSPKTFLSSTSVTCSTSGLRHPGSEHVKDSNLQSRSFGCSQWLNRSSWNDKNTNQQKIRQIKSTIFHEIFDENSSN